MVEIWNRERSQRRGSHGQTGRLAFKVLDMGKLVSEVKWVLLAIVGMFLRWNGCHACGGREVEERFKGGRVMNCPQR